jgi:DnaK suppressor protein
MPEHELRGDAVPMKKATMPRHADDTLREARARLHTRAAELRERIGRVRADLRRDYEPLPRDSAEAAIALENDEVLEAIQATARTELAHVQHALANIDAGVFGRCERCGDPIEAARLVAVPYATRCGACETRS